MLCVVVKVRAIGPEEWELWRQLRLAALAEAPYAFGSRLEEWQGAGDREERWRARLRIPGSYNVVAFVDGRPAGMASGVPHEGDVVELISMWVDPHVRRQGVAAGLIAAVQGWAHRIGARLIRLAVAEGNTAAVATYERSGFAYTGEVEAMPDGVHRERILTKPIPTVDQESWPQP